MINLSQYPYLASGLLSVIIAILAYIFLPSSRKFMMISGLALTFLSIASYFFYFYFQESYWTTKRLFNWSYGIEDLLFAFPAGSVIAFWGSVIFNLNIDKKFDKTLFFRRFFFVTLIEMIFIVLLLFAGIDIMNVTIIAQVILFIIFSFINRHAMLISLITAAAYTSFYFVMLKLLFFIFPAFINDWNGYALWKSSILGVPTEEIVWVFTFNAAWVHLLIFYLNINVLTLKKNYCGRKN